MSLKGPCVKSLVPKVTSLIHAGTFRRWASDTVFGSVREWLILGWKVCWTVWKPKSRSSFDFRLKLVYHFVIFILFWFTPDWPYTWQWLRATPTLWSYCFSLPSMYPHIGHVFCLYKLTVVTGGWRHSHISHHLLFLALSLSLLLIYFL